jgi:nucleotide-binding universal stress UspA family protein
VRSRFQRARDVDLVVLQGDPAQTIVHRADQDDALLIAMATHGRTGPARTALGSVAGDVIRRSTVPVLVVRHGLTMLAHRPERVLVALDTSNLGEAAVRAVQPLTQRMALSIVLFHALELPSPTLPVQGAAIPLGLPPSHAPDEVTAYLDGLAETLRSEGRRVEARLALGSPVESIVLAAEQTGAGLIAMSTHGRTGLPHWLLGSVAEGVIARAPVPVLVLRPREIGRAMRKVDA